MQSETAKREPGAFDCFLLAAAFILGIAATLRAFEVDRVTLPAAGLLAGAAVLSLRPLLRLFHGFAADDAPRESIIGETLAAAAALKLRRRTIVAAVFGAHLVATLFFFPPEDILNDRPVLTLDHSLHFYQAERAREIFPRSGRLHTYEPSFMAGHPAGTIFDIDSKGVELWCSLLRMLDTARAYKLFILIGHLLLPITVYAACRRLRFPFGESVYATLVLIAFWHWGRPYAGHFRYAGMFSYLFVCHLSLYLAGLMRSFLGDERVKRFYVLGPLAFFIHPTAAVLLPAPFIALFLAERRRVPEGRAHRAWEMSLLLRLLLWCLLVLVVNALWLVPFFRYLDIKVPSETFFQLAGLGGLAGVLAKPGNLPALVLVALAVLGCARLASERRLATAAAPAAGSLFLLFISGFGIYMPVFNQMEPGRFLVPALVFMAPLAGAGCALFMEALRNVLRAPALARALGAAVATILLVSSPVLALMASRAFYRHTLSTTYTPAASELIEALERHTNAGGRLMIEDGPAWAYGDTFLPALLPSYTGVEQIGGPYPFTFIRHHFASFRTCRAFGRPLCETDPERLREYLELYNVRWILTATPECRGCLEDLPYASTSWSSGDFALWEVSPLSSFASSPGVVVRAEYGSIHVRIGAVEGEPPPERILLRYHWDRGLEVAPPARIVPEKRLDDPVPFILLEPHGETDIRIVFR